MREKENKLIITDYKEKRVSLLFSDQKAYDIEVYEREKGVLGSIHVAKVKDLVPNIDAAFVDIEYRGEKITCFYSLKDNRSPLYADQKEHEAIRPGDEIIVQVVREAAKTKGPIVSSKLALSGIYSVAAAGEGRVLFSSKIRDADWKEEAREALRQTAKGVDILVRTHAYRKDFSLIESEAEALRQKLLSVIDLGAYRRAPSLLHEDESAYIHLMKKLGEDLTQVITDIEEVHLEIANYCRERSPALLEKLRYYQDPLLSLGKLYAIESVFSEALAKKVWLKSGAYLVIEQTEALSVIDVNTGKKEGNAYSKKGDARRLIRETNFEAMPEIARQLRLRNLSGIILIDFIDMESKEDREALLRRFNEELEKDPVKARALGFTALHLMEMTRQKIKKPLHEHFLREKKERE